MDFFLQEKFYVFEKIAFSDKFSLSYFNKETAKVLGKVSVSSRISLTISESIHLLSRALAGAHSFLLSRNKNILFYRFIFSASFFLVEKQLRFWAKSNFLYQLFHPASV